MCHLNTDGSSLCTRFSGGSSLQAAPETVEFSSKTNEAGRGGKGSGELAGDKGSNAKEEHSGSGNKDSGFRVGDSEGSVEDTIGVCGIGSVNTVSRGGDKDGGAEEVASVVALVDVDTLRIQTGRSELVNTDGPTGASDSGTGTSETLTE